MSKLVIDVDLQEEYLQDNCIIVYKNKKWQVETKDSYIGDVIAKQNEINEKHEEAIKKLENNLLKLAQIVKEK